MAYKCVIVGGGLQGCYFAVLLSRHYGHANIAILDPQPRLLHRWLQRSAACRMYYMRSTSVHHLAPAPNDLLRFARQHGYGKQHFTAPYLRPSLKLFNAHCQAVLRRFALARLHLHGELCGLEYRPQKNRKQASWLLQYRLADGTFASLQSHNVLLALGDQGEYWGNFAADGHTWHLSNPNFSLEQVLQQDRQGQNVCFVGDGISIAQIAVFLLEQGKRVKIYSRYPLPRWRSFQFDSEPGWLRKFLPSFQAETNLQHRWQTIVQARHKGSVPPDLYQQLLAFERRGLLVLENGSPDSATPTVLATGLRYETPAWLLELGKQWGLPLLRTQQGEKPALRDSLEWHSKKAPGLYLAGRLGELLLGPAAGNIAGARLAARYLPVK